ncbi:MAG: hypothetical protein KC486_12740 [Myxococcales bacterium]|nr:hypothetical protein [Myxococcales bacterium]
MKDRIVSVGYRPLPTTPRRVRPARTIARWALALAWRTRATKVSLGLCAMVVILHVPPLVLTVLVNATAKRFGDEGGGASEAIAANMDTIVGDTQGVLSSFVGAQTYFTVIAMAVIAAGLIAEDRRVGALDLYFARPLRLRDYVAGKLLAAWAIPALTIVVPFLLLWLLAVGVTPPGLRASLLWLGFPGLVGALLASVVLTTTVVGASALGERGRTIGVIYVFVWLLLSAVGESLAANGIRGAGYLSPARDVATMVEALLDAGPPSIAAASLKIRGSVNPSALLSALSLLGFAGLGLGALLARLRREVAE